MTSARFCLQYSLTARRHIGTWVPVREDIITLRYRAFHRPQQSPGRGQTTVNKRLQMQITYTTTYSAPDPSYHDCTQHLVATTQSLHFEISKNNQGKSIYGFLVFNFACSACSAGLAWLGVMGVMVVMAVMDVMGLICVIGVLGSARRARLSLARLGVLDYRLL